MSWASVLELVSSASFEAKKGSTLYHIMSGETTAQTYHKSLFLFPGRRMDGCMKEIGQTIRSSTSEIRERAMLATGSIVKLKVWSMKI